MDRFDRNATAMQPESHHGLLDAPLRSPGSFRYPWRSRLSPVPTLEVKHLEELARHRAVVAIGRHDLAHEAPPAAAHVGTCNRRPALLALDLGIAEEIVRVGIEINRAFASPPTAQTRPATPAGASPGGSTDRLGRHPPRRSAAIPP